MALFKILKGDSSRIGVETTPFHDGYAYFTPNNRRLYIDAEENGRQERFPITGDPSQYISLTLLATSWQNQQQTIAVAGLKAGQNGVVAPAQNLTEAQEKALSQARLYIVSQTEGALTIGARGETPTLDVPIAVVLLP